MTGCEACSALVDAGDTFCATCGADLTQAGARRPDRPAATAKVDIPVRRYGHAPRAPRAWRSEAAQRAGRRRRVLVAALVSAGVAIGLLAALQDG